MPDDLIQRLRESAEFNLDEVRTRIEAAAEIERLRAELRNIAEAKRFDSSYFEDDTQFADWAQSRARAALAGEKHDR